MVFKYFFGWVGGGLEKWGLKMTSAKVEVEVEAELGNFIFDIFNHLKVLAALKLRHLAPTPPHNNIG